MPRKIIDVVATISVILIYTSPDDSPTVAATVIVLTIAVVTGGVLAVLIQGPVEATHTQVRTPE